jgi:hypothetical protein
VSQIAPIYLDDRIPDGYVFVCSGNGAEHSFLLPKLGPSIECPRCGRTALSPALLDAYYTRMGPLAYGRRSSEEPFSRNLV